MIEISQTVTRIAINEYILPFIFGKSVLVCSILYLYFIDVFTQSSGRSVTLFYPWPWVQIATIPLNQNHPANDSESQAYFNRCSPVHGMIQWVDSR